LNFNDNEKNNRAKQVKRMLRSTQHDKICFLLSFELNRNGHNGFAQNIKQLKFVENI